MRAPRASALVLAAAAGCSAGPSLPAARFANAPIVGVVDDRLDVAKPPADRLFLPTVYAYDGYVQRRLTRALELPRDQRALGVNALDEVPDSTWFTNRIGARVLTPDEVRTGPLTTDSPELHRPWTVRSTKIGGSSLGLIIKDTRGAKYLVKFDRKGEPEIETATHVIVNRLLWAAGYNVAEDQIVYLRAEDLVLARDAVRKKADGSADGVLDRATLERDLALVEHERDGRIRALASRWIDGKAVGGHPAEGVRDDDPNDRIPHQLRRDLRGAFPIFAWVDHVDVMEGNFLDAWIADPGEPERHYVKHYLIDFGMSLGGMAYLGSDLRRGHTYTYDVSDMLWTMATLGTTDRDWQHRPLPRLRGVGAFDDVTFDPGDWHPDYPTYVPFRTADRFDKFWGARIVARFTREQIRAAVDAGKLSDPRSADYVVDTLVARQRATVAYWFARVNPLAGFDASARAGGVELCFADEAIVAGLASAAATRYAIAGYDYRGLSLGAPMGLVASRDGHTCVPAVALAPAADDGGYTIFEIATARPAFAGETFVHVASDPSSGAPRVIGVWRR